MNNPKMRVKNSVPELEAGERPSALEMAGMKPPSEYDAAVLQVRELVGGEIPVFGATPRQI